MTMNEAKKDAIARLAKAGVAVRKIEGRTINFMDLARARPIYLKITTRGQIDWRTIKQLYFDDIPKPSQGGYIVSYVIAGES